MMFWTVRIRNVLGTDQRMPAVGPTVGADQNRLRCPVHFPTPGAAAEKHVGTAIGTDVQRAVIRSGLLRHQSRYVAYVRVVATEDKLADLSGRSESVRFVEPVLNAAPEMS